MNITEMSKSPTKFNDPRNWNAQPEQGWITRESKQRRHDRGENGVNYPHIKSMAAIHSTFSTLKPLNWKGRRKRYITSITKSVENHIDMDDDRAMRLWTPVNAGDDRLVRWDRRGEIEQRLEERCSNREICTLEEDKECFN